MSGFRDANLLLISLSTHAQFLQAGLGVSPEVILPPTHSFSTQVYVQPSLSTSDPNRKWSDYAFQPQPGLVSRSLFTDPGDGTGQSVVDWKALDAFFRHIFSTLNLSKPPLAQHILLSVPPSISNATRDKLTQLFFENLQAPALFLVDSALLHLLATSHTSGISIDLGTHSTLIGYVHDSIVLRHCSLSFPLGETDCDNYLIALLLAHDPTLPSRLCPDSFTPSSLYQALSGLIASLKADGHISFEPTLSELTPSLAPNATVEEDENAITDVAQAIVSGKVEKLLGRQISAAGGSIAGSAHSRRSTNATGKRLQAEILKETDTIVVSLPTNSSAVPLLEPSRRMSTDFGPVQIPPALSPQSELAEIQIGKLRHRHAEPLFSPAVLATIPPTFAQHGLEDWAVRYTPELIANAGDGLVAAAQVGLKKVNGQNQRREVTEHVVLTGEGGLTCRTKGLVEMLAKELGAKALKVPDYFSEFKGRPELLGFLGGAIVAKLVFNDASASKLWISKPDYNREGPFVSRKIGEGGQHASSSSGYGTVGSIS